MLYSGIEESDLLREYDNRWAGEACRRWLKLSIHESLSKKEMVAFAAFLGHPFKQGKHHRYVPIHIPEVQNIVDMINGPYGDAILKMLEIKNAEKAKAGSDS